MSKKKSVPVKDLRIRWQFDDGTGGALPIIDVEAQLQAQNHGMARSDDPDLRAEGRRLLNVAAEAAVKGQRSSEAHSQAGQAPRSVTEAVRQSIRRKYAARVAAGEVYGGVRAIAAEFIVSETTVHKLVADLKPRKT